MRLLIKFKLDKTSFPLSISSKLSVISIPPNYERAIDIIIIQAKHNIATTIFGLYLIVFANYTKSYFSEGLFWKLVGSEIVK